MSIGQARMRRRAGGVADADNPSWLQRQRRVANDIDFLAWLRVATLEDLLTHHQVCGHLLPRWRRVALTRAIKKALAEETKGTAAPIEARDYDHVNRVTKTKEEA